MNAPLTTSVTSYNRFLKDYKLNGTGQRFGQAFYNYFELYRMKQTPWHDVLYNATDRNARAMIEATLDWGN